MTSPNKSRSNVDLVKQLYAAFGRRDVAAIFGLFDPEIEIVQSAEIPWGGHYRGYGGAQEFFTKLTAAINSTIAVDRCIDAGDRVVVIGRTQGTVNATGQAYDVPIAHVWTVRNGAMVRAEFFIDIPTMLSAL